MELGANSAVLHYYKGACCISNVCSYSKIIIWEKVSLKRIKSV